MKKMVIAIDGPAGSGKSSVAKEVAKILGYLYLDTGAMYRALTLKAMQKGINLKSPLALTRLANNTRIVLKGERVLVDNDDLTDKIRSPEVSLNTHFVSIVPGVRNRMKILQREMGKRGRVVAEGRDIGTVIFPDAEKKFYLDASPERRAERRYRELKEKGYKVTFKKVLKETLLRDERDRKRDIAPLRKAEDAIYIDTTDMSIQEVVNRVLEEIRKDGKK